MQAWVMIKKLLEQACQTIVNDAEYENGQRGPSEVIGV